MKSSNYKLIKKCRETEDRKRQEGGRERERKIDKKVKARSKRVRQNSGLQKERQNCIVEYLCVWGEVFPHTE